VLQSPAQGFSQCATTVEKAFLNSTSIWVGFFGSDQDPAAITKSYRHHQREFEGPGIIAKIEKSQALVETPARKKQQSSASEGASGQARVADRPMS
jgi:hypothetical protein